MYVDAAYYENDYGGIQIEDAAFLNRLIKRAQRDIDQLTTYRITDFEKLTTFQKERVKEAVCAQVEFLIESGETASTVSGGGGSVSIGAYSEGSRSSTTVDNEPNRYADNVENILWPSGLLYTGVDVIG